MLGSHPSLLEAKRTCSRQSYFPTQEAALPRMMAGEELLFREVLTASTRITIIKNRSARRPRLLHRKNPA